MPRRGRGQTARLRELEGRRPGGVPGDTTRPSPGDSNRQADCFLHAAEVGLRTRGEDQFHLGAVVPLDDPARGEVWILSLGDMRAFT
jgi:hypothetical protein